MGLYLSRLISYILYPYAYLLSAFFAPQEHVASPYDILVLSEKCGLAALLFASGT